MGLLSEHLAEGAAEHGEVLAGHEHLAAVDVAPAGDDAVGVGALIEADIVRPVAGEHVELVEGALVEQVLDALAGQHLALVVLPLDCPLRTGVARLVAAAGQLLEALVHSRLSHPVKPTRKPSSAVRPAVAGRADSAAFGWPVVPAVLATRCITQVRQRERLQIAPRIGRAQGNAFVHLVQAVDLCLRQLRHGHPRRVRRRRRERLHGGA